MRNKSIFFLTILITCFILMIAGALMCATYLKLAKQAKDLTDEYREWQTKQEQQLSPEEWELIWGECDNLTN